VQPAADAEARAATEPLEHGLGQHDERAPATPGLKLTVEAPLGHRLTVAAVPAIARARNSGDGIRV
jgi:hypothetical protein